MTPIAPRPSAGTPLELRCAGMALPAFLPLVQGIPGVMRLVHPHGTADFALGVFSVSVMVMALMLVTVASLRSRALGHVLRLDTEGVTVKGAPTVPWADLSAVHWGKAPGKRHGALAPVVFLPRPGVVLTPVPGPLFRARSEGRAARYTKRYGSPLAFTPAQIRTTGPEVLAAVQRLSPDTPLTSG
ncbi:hypothetical protein [Streptomyces sp. NBC_00503]|uniref:hypothetical protein n=1 Tax=Streptomyces sp. NBC_00503 TaxID=2903659 RepID=UPI002E81ECFF|nr:hypothetical protein [Streptomyces sp. NBC_00503]WUD82914.1 hypothetical protein OG490_21505 [Streptomyces sp. NBC_00503]